MIHLILAMAHLETAWSSTFGVLIKAANMILSFAPFYYKIYDGHLLINGLSSLVESIQMDGPDPCEWSFEKF